MNTLTQVEMAEPSTPAKCGSIEIVGWFVIEHAFGTTPMIMNCLESEANMVMDILRSAPSKSVADYVTIKHYSHSDWSSVADFWRPEDHDGSWHIEVWGPEKKYSPVFSVSCAARDSLQALAMLISHRMPEHEVRFQKWARVRCVWKGMKILREFPQVPYTNGPLDW